MKSCESPNPISASNSDDLETKIDSLLTAILKKYGYDFRDYSKAHVKRRLLNRMRLSKLESVSMLQHQIMYDPSFATQFIRDLSISVTEMFRDPDFYLAFRDKVVPILKTWPYIKIWHAGCSTGEEVYSMAILLKEEGLYNRVQIYATDFNNDALKLGKEGIYSAENIKKYARNYQASGAKGSFSDYYFAQYDSAIMASFLKKNIVWANHNLVTDADFTEAHVIVCRNVLIYFNKELQDKVHHLFHSSLVKGGLLCLGDKESLQFTDCSHNYEALSKKHKIFKKLYL